MRRWLAAALFFILIYGVLATVPAAISAPAPQAGGTLVFGAEVDPDRLDPNLSGLRNSQIVFFQIFEPLIVRDPKDGQFKPWLAMSWEVSSDGRAYTFRLRRDVRFHDGTPFNAAAVKFNMDRTHNPALATRCGGCAVGFYDGADVVDPYTVRIRLKNPWAPFLDAMSLFYRMVSPAAVEKTGDANFGRQPVGTGPFKFVEWIPNNRVVLERNADYTWGPAIFNHKGPAYLERLVFRFIPEPSVRVAALEAGEAQVMILPPPQEFARLVRDPRFKPLIGRTPGVPLAYAVNVTKEPTNELAVRRAMMYAVDREIIARAVYGPYQALNAFRPAYTLLSPTTWGYDKSTELYDFDQERAQAILEEAGWKKGPDGIRVKGGQRLEVALVSNEHGVPEVLQSHMRRIGLSLRISVVDILAANEAQRKGQSHMSPLPAARTDPDILSVFFHSRNAGGGFNFSFVKDPTLDRLLDQGAVEVDTAKRRALYVEAVRHAMDRAYMIPVHTRDIASLMQARVEDLRYDVTGAFPWLYDVWIRP
jgi:peptide/nickel transport system substrate-binding protein